MAWVGYSELSNQLRLKLMAGLLLLLVLMPMAYAVTPVFFDGYAVFPSRGDSQTNILAVIRPDKRTDNKPMWLYIFWDDVPIIRRQMDNMDGTVHTYIWDVVFQPPQNQQYLATGDHTITIWVEDYDGDIKMGVYNFKITEIIPYPEWFEHLSDSTLEALRGPQGVKGDTGSTGPRGSTGPQGETGLWGPQGIQGMQGITGPQGVNGTQGEPGPQGEQGPLGPVGDTTQLSATLLLTNVAISLVAVAISIYTFRKFKA